MEIRITFLDRVLPPPLTETLHVTGGVSWGPLQPRQRLLPQQPRGRDSRVLGGRQQQGHPQAVRGSSSRGLGPLINRTYLWPGIRENYYRPVGPAGQRITGGITRMRSEHVHTRKSPCAPLWNVLHLSRVPVVFVARVPVAMWHVCTVTRVRVCVCAQ